MLLFIDSSFLSHMGNIASIQYLRGVAALLVVYYHSLNFLKDVPRSFYFGYQGVDVFFVISGFIIAHSTVKVQGHSSFRVVFDFWVRRFIRVVPLYWIALGIEWRHELTPSFNMLCDFFFVPRWHDVEVGRVWPKLIPGWTINYEVFFYLCFGLFLTFRRGVWWIFGLFSSCVLVGLIFCQGLQGSPSFVFYTSSVLLEFLYGVLLARLYFAYGSRVVRLKVQWVVLVLVFGVGLLFADLDGPRGVVDGIPALLIVASVLCIRTSGGFSILAKLGDSSYSLYLFHGFFFLAAGRLFAFLGLTGGDVGGAFAAVFRIVFACVGGWLVFVILERPLTSAAKQVSLKLRLMSRDLTSDAGTGGARSYKNDFVASGYSVGDFDYLPGRRVF